MPRFEHWRFRFRDPVPNPALHVNVSAVLAIARPADRRRIAVAATILSVAVLASGESEAP
jgi:hypothetical protein